MLNTFYCHIPVKELYSKEEHPCGCRLVHAPEEYLFFEIIVLHCPRHGTGIRRVTRQELGLGPRNLGITPDQMAAFRQLLRNKNANHHNQGYR